MKPCASAGAAWLTAQPRNCAGLVQVLSRQHHQQQQQQHHHQQQQDAGNRPPRDWRRSCPGEASARLPRHPQIAATGAAAWLRDATAKLIAAELYVTLPPRRRAACSGNRTRRRSPEATDALAAPVRSEGDWGERLGIIVESDFRLRSLAHGRVHRC